MLSRWALEHPALTRYLMVVLMLFAGEQAWPQAAGGKPSGTIIVATIATTMAALSSSSAYESYGFGSLGISSMYFLNAFSESSNRPTCRS